LSAGERTRNNKVKIKRHLKTNIKTSTFECIGCFDSNRFSFFPSPFYIRVFQSISQFPAIKSFVQADSIEEREKEKRCRLLAALCKER
jgi:hypothetical protein